MMATRKRYSREFKLETVKLVTEQEMSRTQVARVNADTELNANAGDS